MYADKVEFLMSRCDLAASKVEVALGLDRSVCLICSGASVLVPTLSASTVNWLGCKQDTLRMMHLKAEGKHTNVNVVDCWVQTQVALHCTDWLLLLYPSPSYRRPAATIL